MSAAGSLEVNAATRVAIPRSASRARAPASSDAAPSSSAASSTTRARISSCGLCERARGSVRVRRSSSSRSFRETSRIDRSGAGGVSAGGAWSSAGSWFEGRPFELLEAGTRLDAQLFDEHAPRRLICLQRLGLPAGAIEREHQVRAWPLPKRIRRDQLLELSDHGLVPPEQEIGFDAILERGETKVFEPGDGGLGERLEAEIRRRRAPPEAERLVELLRRPLRVAGGERLPAFPK